MSTISNATIRALAVYFSGPDVAINSTALGLKNDGPLGLKSRAQRFFATREAIGVTGWATENEAAKAIKERIFAGGGP